jgi:NADPH-dependent 2,4-dienoyl-CoA reductase/sulfur reductase-like enzyme/nitrite reductase/ring-hydroxylating ferredoxin subunit
MAHSETDPTGPNFAEGVRAEEIPSSGFLAGHVDGEPVLLSGIEGKFHAVGATCTHYGAPLSEGLAVGDTVRCPWHHACFSLRTGTALKAPAFDSLPSWKVEQEGDLIFVRTKLEAQACEQSPLRSHPRRIVIVGGGAAGFAATEMLRRRGYQGELTMLSEDEALPCDRPNLSKDYLAGTAPEEWIPLKPADFYEENRIDLHLGARVARIDVARRKVIRDDGIAYPFDALLLATGAAPVRLQTPGFDRPNVHTLRTLGNAGAIIEATKEAKAAAVIGASFIGLEVAASLATRGLKVHVIAPDAIPMQKILGPEIGLYVRHLHERHGVVFHLGHKAQSYDGERLVLDDGNTVAAELVVLGVGVTPRSALASQCGIAVDDGIRVDEYLETNVPGIFAAGDVANYPLPGTGERARIEHWVVAQRQGQTAALNMLGERQAYRDVPFFWSRHYDVSIHYVGHAAAWDEARVSGSVPAGDCEVRFYETGVQHALASIGRPLESLIEEARAEAEGASPPSGCGELVSSSAPLFHGH